jgi:tRNA uridine 5-carboxymethylaminomethyl modification enzyme
MSCNPAIGGLGKGHLVREIDALDGVMGRLGDVSGIQFRLLNRSKGAAVQGPRSQIDRRLYREAMQAELARTPNLTLMAGTAEESDHGRSRVVGVVTARGRTCPRRRRRSDHGHLPERRHPQGRPAHSGGPSRRGALDRLAADLYGAGLQMGRLEDRHARAPRRPNHRLGPAGDAGRRRRARAVQLPDRPDRRAPDRLRRDPHDEETHRIIAANLGESAVYGGHLSGRGPRYCPSIEDKVVRFADKTSHQIFLEPEGLDDPTVYPNGISTSVSDATQLAFLRTMPGLEAVEVFRFGYAIEYDYVDPRELTRRWRSSAPRPVSGRPDQRHDRL